MQFPVYSKYHTNAEQVTIKLAKLGMKMQWWTEDYWGTNTACFLKGIPSQISVLQHQSTSLQCGCHSKSEHRMTTGTITHTWAAKKGIR